MSWADNWSATGGFIPDHEINRFKGTTRVSSGEAVTTASRELRGDLAILTRGETTWSLFTPLNGAHNSILWRTHQSPKPVRAASGDVAGLVIPTAGMEIVASSSPGAFAAALPLLLEQRRTGSIIGRLENICMWSRIPVGTPDEKIQRPTAFKEDPPTE